MIQELGAVNPSVPGNLHGLCFLLFAAILQRTPRSCTGVDRLGVHFPCRSSAMGCRDTHGSSESRRRRGDLHRSRDQCRTKGLQHQLRYVHAGGITKTNQNVGLDPETLALATPARDNVDALVDYMKDPTSYDGEYSISDVHPSMRSAELYPAMRDLDDEDLRLMAGYILVSPKVQGSSWGGGKIYF